MSTSQTKVELKHPLVPIKDKKVKLILSKEIQSEITYLHAKVGAVEWSGTLLYRKLEGSVLNPETLVLKAERVYLGDIGTPGGTDFDPILSVEKLEEDYPEVITGELKKGVVHTHHNMNVYFSGVDNGELSEHSTYHIYYLSLITGFDVKKTIAKVAIPIKTTLTAADTTEIVQMKNDEGVIVKIETPKEYREQTSIEIRTYECDIEWEAPSDIMKNLYEEVSARKVPVIQLPKNNKATSAFVASEVVPEIKTQWIKDLSWTDKHNFVKSLMELGGNEYAVNKIIELGTKSHKVQENIISGWFEDIEIHSLAIREGEISSLEIAELGLCFFDFARSIASLRVPNVINIMRAYAIDHYEIYVGGNDDLTDDVLLEYCSLKKTSVLDMINPTELNEAMTSLFSLTPATMPEIFKKWNKSTNEALRNTVKNLLDKTVRMTILKELAKRKIPAGDKELVYKEQFCLLFAVLDYFEGETTVAKTSWLTVSKAETVRDVIYETLDNMITQRDIANTKTKIEE